MKIILFLFLVLGAMSSCKSEKGSGENLKEIPLHSERLLKNTDLFVKWAYKVRVQDSLLCIWDLHGGDKYFHLYSYPQLQFITSFAVNGRGPEEYVATAGFTFDKHNNINVWDATRARLSIFNTDSLMQQRTTPAQIISYPDLAVPVLSSQIQKMVLSSLTLTGKTRLPWSIPAAKS